ncbi:hypothetical protein AB0N07_44485 [Streptomyces sp. NPDC051172]|uniref:hypothetical protein n=1 Tax=Streptomyces sp. NPDC051172 TaxID=3155796 RepID=UPI00343900BF
MCRQSATICLIKPPALDGVTGFPLVERFRPLPDPHRRRGVRHPFVAVLLIAASAVAADRVGLTRALAAALPRGTGPGWRDRGVALVQLACAIALGATNVLGAEQLHYQWRALFPKPASDSTLRRAPRDRRGHGRWRLVPHLSI